jgi:hypothetical protein
MTSTTAVTHASATGNIPDGALFYDADQHDQTHIRVDVQVDVKQQQREQRAEARL